MRGDDGRRRAEPRLGRRPRVEASHGSRAPLPGKADRAIGSREGARVGGKARAGYDVAAAGPEVAGRVTEMRQPRPFGTSIRMSPPWERTMPCAMLRPRPRWPTPENVPK